MMVVTPSRAAARGSRRAGAHAPRSRRAPTAARRAAAATATSRARARARRAAAGRPKAVPDTWVPRRASPTSVEQLAAPAIGDRRAALATVDEAVGDVVVDREVREQRVRLEHDAVVALDRRAARETSRPFCITRSRVLRLETRDDAQERGLAAARRAEEARPSRRGARQSRPTCSATKRAERLGDGCRCAGTLRRRAATGLLRHQALRPCAARASRSLVRRAARASLLRLRLRVVALAPLREDLVAILRRPREVVLDETASRNPPGTFGSGFAMPGTATIAKFFAVERHRGVDGAQSIEASSPRRASSSSS